MRRKVVSRQGAEHSGIVLVLVLFLFLVLDRSRREFEKENDYENENDWENERGRDDAAQSKNATQTGIETMAVESIFVSRPVLASTRKTVRSFEV